MLEWPEIGSKFKFKDGRQVSVAWMKPRGKTDHWIIFKVRGSTVEERMTFKQFKNAIVEE